MKTLKDRLEHLQKDLTQKDFANKIGIPLNTYTAWLRNERLPSYDAIQKVCTALCVSADWLLTGSDNVRTSLTYTMRERLYEAKGATGLRVPQLADRMGVNAEEVERIMNEGGEPSGTFLSAFEDRLQPEIDRIKSTPCAGCRSKDAEIAFLRTQLSEALARIPKPKEG